MRLTLLLKVTKGLGGRKQMLDSLIVLGQVPGTGIVITFTEILIGLLIFFLYQLEKRHRKEIRRAIKHYYKRTRINIRKTKRHTRWLIIRQRRKATMSARRFKRGWQLRIRRTRRKILWTIISRFRKTRRYIKLKIRRSKKWMLAQTYYRYLRLKRRAILRVRQARRNLIHSLAKRQRRLNRSYLRFLNKIKRTKLVQGIILIKSLVDHRA